MYDYGYYDYGYDYGYQAAESAVAGLLVFGIIMWVIGIAICVLTIISMWKLFTKAGKPGWAAIVPVYNIIVMLEIAELPMWYIALYFVPFANIYAMFKMYIEFVHKFGKSTGFGVLMVFFAPIVLPILAFSKNTIYVGNNNVQQAYQQPTQVNVMQQTVQPEPMVAPVVEPVAPVQPEPMVTPVVEPVAPVQPEPMVTPVVEPVAPVQPEPMAAPVVEPVAPVQPEVSSVPNQELNNQPVAPAFCTNCGNALAPNTKFCTNCGKQI